MNDYQDFYEQEQRAKRLYDLLNLGADQTRFDQMPQEVAALQQSQVGAMQPYQDPDKFPGQIRSKMNEHGPRVTPQQQMEYEVDRINRQNESKKLSDLAKTEKSSVTYTPTSGQYLTMREAFNPATYGFGPDSGAALQMPEGQSPDRVIDRMEYFKPGGEYWGNTPQVTVVPSQRNAQPSSQMNVGNANAQWAQQEAEKARIANERGQTYRPDIPSELTGRTGSMTPSEMTQIQDMFKPVYKKIVAADGTVLGSEFDREATNAQQRQAFDLARKFSDEDIKRRSSTADMLKKEREAKEGGKVEANWQTVESGGKMYQVNTKTGEMRPAVVGDTQLTGKPENLTPVTNAAGDVTWYNPRGKAIKTDKGVGKPSSTYEKGIASRKKGVEDMDTVIRELEAATATGGLIEKSTGSGIGSLYDAGARFIGQSTQGGRAVGSLRPIFDLVLKMVPRFEGPQSNMDTQSYKEAAGDIANPNVTNDEKLDAAKIILRLMKERRNQFVAVNPDNGEEIPLSQRETAPSLADQVPGQVPTVEEWVRDPVTKKLRRK